ncbi:DUF6352 family protein [Paracraurococcus ruber]|uniref:Uncharacterized protein n=1 Tax=Paracraurococcus ruber TaxID=77675 RepID=A0ABS1CS90_9PROT|nr:DUF6352 family protein [Paracraurococcus ruber]MBK1657250.1 hypothetical protein [Paracraurococcus ruber]TDG32371.1 hypothetical protein E2C05_07590 [Paracraurococcus ruber]
MSDFWVASGHLFCDRDAAGRLVPTPDLWRAFLARPELLPPEEACDAELALHTGLLADPLRPVPPAQLAALADADARENWQVFLGFRDRVQAQASLEAAWLSLFRGNVAGIPPLFLQMLTHLIARAALEGESDAYTLRAGELLFRPQRAAIHQGATLLADEEHLDARAADGDLGTIGRLLTEAGAPPRTVELDVLSDALAPGYRARSDAHDLALDIAEGRPGQHGMARALERFIGHVFGEAVTIRPAPVIEDPAWTWHVGLDTEATAIANDLWHGRPVAQARLARILWLGVLEFADATRVLPRAAGRPVYLALAMDAAQRVRMKPQNLVGLPLVAAEAGA